MLVLLCFTNQFCVLSLVRFSLVYKPFSLPPSFHSLFSVLPHLYLLFFQVLLLYFYANIRDAQLPVIDPDFPILGGVRLYKFYLTLFPCIAPQGVVEGEYQIGAVAGELQLRLFAYLLLTGLLASPNLVLLLLLSS